MGPKVRRIPPELLLELVGALPFNLRWATVRVARAFDAFVWEKQFPWVKARADNEKQMKDYWQKVAQSVLSDLNALPIEHIENVLAAIEAMLAAKKAEMEEIAPDEVDQAEALAPSTSSAAFGQQQKKLTDLNTEMTRVRSDNDQLRKRITKLEADNDQLRTDNDQLRKRITKLEADNDQLRTDNDQLRKRVTELEAETLRQQQEHKCKLAEVEAELKSMQKKLTDFNTEMARAEKRKLAELEAEEQQQPLGQPMPKKLKQDDGGESTVKVPAEQQQLEQEQAAASHDGEDEGGVGEYGDEEEEVQEEDGNDQEE